MIRSLSGLIPDRTLFKYLGMLLTSALLLPLLRIFTEWNVDALAALWWWLPAMTAGLALVDALRLCTAPEPSAWRQLPSNLALGATARIRLRFDNPGTDPVRLSCTDDYPDALITEQLPVELEIPPRRVRRRRIFGASHPSRAGPFRCHRHAHPLTAGVLAAAACRGRRAGRQYLSRFHGAGATELPRL